MVLPVVAVERVIPETAEKIFGILADPVQHAVIDGSGSVTKTWSSGSRLELGSTFGASMRLGVRYRITNTVVEFEEGRRIAWRHWAGHRWRYLLAPAEGGTSVREEWDASRLPSWSQRILRVAGFPDRNRRGMIATLERLEEQVSGTARPAS